MVSILFSVCSNPGIAAEGPLQQHHVLLPGLSEAEVDGLQFMREEEKVARDVYSLFYTFYNIPVFNNISGSEQWHMDQILTLLNRYGINDPAAQTLPGEFTQEELQTLYQSLIDFGSGSLVDGLYTGAVIEEVDILDLEEQIQLTTHSDIETTYRNLQWASGNHLKAFVRQLSFHGITYEPVLLDPETYQAIIDR